MKPSKYISPKIDKVRQKLVDFFDRHANLKYKYGSRNFWCRGYYVDTVGKNKKVIEEIHTKPVGRRLFKRSNKYKRIYGPVYG